MRIGIIARRACLAGVMLLAGAWAAQGAVFRLATYNVENYLDAPGLGRQPKAEESKAKVREMIRALNADVIALQEMGRPSALEELRRSLRSEGVEYGYWEHVTGFDTNVHVAVLSKFPIVARRSHTNENFLLGGRRFRVSRGFAEVDIAVGTNYTFTLLTAHLKSKRVIPEADEAEMRLAEARLLREKVDALLSADPERNVVVLGDLNDTKDSASTRAVIGRGRLRLVDTRPAERNGDNVPSSNPAWDPRNVTWTHYYGKEDSYSRIDYILLSPGMAREWVTNETYVLAAPNWGVASDHRPLVATFRTDSE
ncbi:MAG TPA: endonuclease/exonuclease/phosphatase family protein [Candidatus Paceibacterota bacterium]|nr:endonuclease/exonuclease/phosphatase family protein [Candidatus Paceibacterota bacterium]